MKKFSNNRRSLSEDIAKVALIFEIPKLAKLLVDSIPDLTYERYIKEYKKIWNMALPAASFAIIRKYAHGGLEKTFISWMLASVSREINDRAKRENEKKAITLEIENYDPPSEIGEIVTSRKFATVSDCINLLNQQDFDVYMQRINSLPIDYRNRILDSIVPDIEMMKSIISLLDKHEKGFEYSETDAIELFSLPPEKMYKILYLKLQLSLDDESFKKLGQEYPCKG